MKIPLITAISAAISSATLLLVVHAAGQPSLQTEGSTLTAQAKLSFPYRINLSLNRNWNANYTGLPMTTVAFVNATPHTLVFALTSPFAEFAVEYKTAQAGLTSDTGWKMLRSDAESSPKTNDAGRIKASQNHVIIGRISPLSQESDQYNLVGFPMSAEGFYRITAITSIPDVRETDGPPDAPVIVRTFTLNLRSNSVIVQRTPKGFVEVSPTMGKKAIPK